jgi:CDGSH-type Zn-finger protein/nitrite reductase/ring-hydroxylating ferredoxin subunit
MKQDPAKPSPTIRLEPDGPLIVSGLTDFKNSRGEPIKTGESVRLCRCGASKTKPFCDNTHVDIGFSDAKSDERVPDQLDTYPAEQVTILDNRGICSHAGYCTSGLPEVWRTAVEPWIDAEGADREAILETLRKCPSGALSYMLDGEVETEFNDDTEIQLARNAAYRVRGSVTIEGVEFLDGASQEHYTLCRCGGSRNKPFCDGSHWYRGFRDDEALTISKAARGSEERSDAWVDVGAASDFEVGQVYPLAVQERQIALVPTDDGWFALDGRCPHQGGPLSEGVLRNGAVRCPWHGHDFDLKTGKGVGNPDRAETFKVREQDGRIEIAIPKPKRSEWTVSHVIAETMVEWGVDTVFGMVGHSNLGMAEAIRVQEERGKLRYFGIRHEGAAAFAASGYAKVSGRPAACLSIAGPGATNLLTGLWDAKVDRAPVLALTGQINTQVMGPGAFQEIELAAAFEPVARFSHTVLPGSDHAELTSLALKNAIVERDVAHLILPDEVQVLDVPGQHVGDSRLTGGRPPMAEWCRRVL